MGEIVPAGKISTLIKKLKKAGKSICLVGGCFDVLHPGHVIFLKKAKKEGDSLIVLLESDEKVKKLKGINRPVHTQKERAKVLSALRNVDYIVLLPYMQDEEDYDNLIGRIRPDVIATTVGDPDGHYKKRSAKMAGAKLKYVTRIIGSHSSSAILTSKG